MGLSAKKSKKMRNSDSDSDEYNDMEYEEVEDDYVDDDGEEEEEEEEEEEHGEEGTDGEENRAIENDEMEQLEKEYRDLYHQELDTLKNLKHHKDEDLLKGQAVKSQKALWYKILELRFLIQKPFSNSNRLPQEPIRSSFCELDETVRESYSDLMSSSKETIDSILELQEALFANNPLITQSTNGSERSSKDLEASKHLEGNLDQEWSQISQMHKSIASFRDKSINKWQRMTQVTTGAAAIKGKLHAFNQDISNQVAAYMRDPSRMIKQMQLRRSAINTFGAVPDVNDNSKEVNSTIATGKEAEMGSCSVVGKERLEMFEVGPCKDAYEMGLLIGQRFSELIRSRVAKDLILQNQLRPFADSPQSESLLKALFDNNQRKFPRYWDELLGTAAGSGVPLLDILLINFRKEILAFIPKEGAHKSSNEDTLDDCSDVLVVGESMAIAAHNEDANVALVGHTYLIKGIMPDGLFFVGYTYAGELPTCAFGFNSHGLAFTLDSVPPAVDEIVEGGIGRNFISRDILEATSIDDAMNRIHSAEVSVGHSYNLIETSTRRICNVETASRKRISVYEVGKTPFFHANMYLHLNINQVQDENSIARQKRAVVLKKISKEDFLSLLGDMDDEKYPIYMTGPLLHTLCTAVFDLDEQTLSIISGNPKSGDVSHVFSTSPNELKGSNVKHSKAA